MKEGLLIQFSQAKEQMYRIGGESDGGLIRRRSHGFEHGKRDPGGGAPRMKGRKGLWWSEGDLEPEQTRLEASDPKPIRDVESAATTRQENIFSLGVFGLTNAVLLQ